jgi:Phage tail protein
MTVERFTIYDSSFTKIDFGNLDIKPYDFQVDPPEPQHAREEVDGADGTNTLGTLLAGRTMRGKFSIKAHDRDDFYLIVSRLYAILNGKNFLYIVDNRQPGKRWARVKVNSRYDINRLNPHAGETTIEFMSDYAVCESIFKTVVNQFSVDDDILQYGQGVPDDLTDIVYDTTAASFSIWNGGDIEIEPRELPLTVEVTAAQTSSNTTLSITNYTNGITWSYTGPTVAGQTIVLDGSKAEIGGASVALKTNYALLNLVPGFNQIERNSGISRVKFMFRFYYYG